MVYLLCFDKKLSHAKHYIGYCDRDPQQRLKRHNSGNGARILRACRAEGITPTVVRVWPNADRSFERKLKKRKKARMLCPLCNPTSYATNGRCDD